MKKFILFSLMAFVMCSCATYSYMGNITLLTNDGNIIEKWDNAIVAQGDDYNGTYNTPYKNSGLEFTTSQGETIYVNGGIIIMKNIEKIYNLNQTQNENDKNNLVAQYKSVSKEIDELKISLKFYDKNSTQYIGTKTQITILKKQLTKIGNMFFEISNGEDIYNYL